MLSDERLAEIREEARSWEEGSPGRIAASKLLTEVDRLRQELVKARAKLQSGIPDDGPPPPLPYDHGNLGHAPPAAVPTLAPVPDAVPKCFLDEHEDCGAATCVGEYEGERGDVRFLCDTHCGHGNEDGWCVPIAQGLEELRARLSSALAEVAELELRLAVYDHPGGYCQACGGSISSGVCRVCHHRETLRSWLAQVGGVHALPDEFREWLRTREPGLFEAAWGKSGKVL